MPFHTRLVHIPHPDSVAKNKNYRRTNFGTAIKTSRIQPPLDILHIPESTYSPLPSDLESYTKSQKYPAVKSLKLST